MNIKVTCDKCGHDNELGRVFCTGCGQKLNLIHKTSVHELKVSLWKIMLHAAIKAFFVIVIIIILTGLVLAFWPLAMAGRMGDPRGQQRLAQKIHSANAVLPGQQKAIVFSESEINWYLEKAKNRGDLQLIAVQLTRQHFIVRATSGISLPFTLPGGKNNIIPYSLALGGEFTNGNWAITSRAMGHLPLFGVLRAIAEKPVKKFVEQNNPFISTISKVEFEEGKLQATFQK